MDRDVRHKKEGVTKDHESQDLVGKGRGYTKKGKKKISMAKKWTSSSYSMDVFYHTYYNKNINIIRLMNA